jgi:hypothetical protein
MASRKLLIVETQIIDKHLVAVHGFTCRMTESVMLMLSLLE